MDYGPITSVVQFGSLVLAVLAVLSAVALVYVVLRGGQWLLDVIRGFGEYSDGYNESLDEDAPFFERVSGYADWLANHGEYAETEDLPDEGLEWDELGQEWVDPDGDR